MPKQAPPEFIAWLKSQMEAQGWNITRTAREAGVSQPVVSDILNLGEQPTFETCKGLAKAFDKPLMMVLVLAGHEQEKNDPVSLREWMGLIEDVPEEKVAEWIAAVRALRKQFLKTVKEKA